MPAKVFRTQEIRADQPSEYDQVGFEIFDGSDPAAADAEMFALIADALASLPVRPSNGRHRNSNGGCFGIIRERAAEGGADAPHLASGAIPRAIGTIWRQIRSI